LDALRRTEAAPASRRRGRPWLVRGVVLAALAAVAWFAVVPLLRGHRRVRTAEVRLATSEEAARATAAEATGWIEPSPFPVVVRPLVDGVVESIDVLEGVEVAKGVTVIGRLRNADKEAALERAEAALLHRESHVSEVQAELDEAVSLLEQRLDARREVARLASEADAQRAAADAARAETAAAEGRLEAARADVAAQEALERGGAGVALPLARARGLVSSAEAEARSKHAELARVEASLRGTEAMLVLAREGLQKPAALEGAVNRYRAHLAAAKVERDAARVERDVAKREVGWLTVLAPVDGVVLRREAAPGSIVGPGVMPNVPGREAMKDSGVGGLVSLYDPARLQARINVPLGSVSAIGVGRPAEITVDTLPGKVFRGKVIRLQSEADVLLGALQVKVSIDDPHPLLRPEIVARARFLGEAPKTTGAPVAARILVPKAALKGDAVFVVDPRGGGRARRVPVKRGAESGDSVEVEGDVSVAHRVILDDVEDGERVTGDAS
jgi:multidrug efflux pump subunit AcrA (membrane-fusion protein)